MKFKLFIKFLKKKKELWVIMGLLIISITFLMGVLNSTNAFRSNTMMNIVNQYPTDYSISRNNWDDTDEFLTTYFSNYEGPFEIDHTFRTEKIIFTDAKIVGDNTSETGILINQLNRSYGAMHLIGIDEVAHNLLNSKDMRSTVFLSNPINFSSTGILISNLFREHQADLADMKLNIFNEIETTEEGEISTLNLNFSNISTSVENSVSVDGYFEIYDIDLLFKALGLGPSYFSSDFPILLGNLDTIMELFPNSTYEISHVRSDPITNIVFNKAKLSKYSSTQISQDLISFRRELRNYDDYDDFDDYDKDNTIRGTGTWAEEIERLTEYNLKFQLISITLFLPIIMICYNYFKISNEYMISKRSREIGLCLVNGMTKKQIKAQYYGAAILVGIMGGIIGNLSGWMLSLKIGEVLFPNIQLGYSEFLPSNFLLNSILLSIFAAVISYIAIRKPLQQILSQNLENILETKKFELEKPKRIKQLEWILFGGCMYAFIFSTIQLLFFESFNFEELYDKPPLLFIAIIIAIPFLPLFVFVFPSFLIKFVMKQLKDLSRKIAEKKMFKKSPFKVKLFFWNWTQKSERNQKLITVFSLSVIFIFITSSLSTSFSYSQAVYESTLTANADKIDLEFLGNTSLTAINQFNSDLSQNLSEYHLKSLNTLSFTAENNEFVYDMYDPPHVPLMNDIKILNLNNEDLWYYQFVCFNISNLQNNAELRDDWFIGGSYTEIFNKLQQPNAMLVPSYILKLNISLNDQVNFYYTNDRGEKIYKNATIIGAYNIFPTFTETSSFNREIIVNPQLIENATLKKATYLFYGDADLNATHLFQLKTRFYQNLPDDFTFLDSFSRYDPLETEFDALQFDFIKLESFLFAFYMIFGVFIHSALSNMSLAHEIGLLRSRGVSKKDLIKLNLSEILLILGIGFVLSTISLIGINTLMIFLNIIRADDYENLFLLIYQQPKITDLIGIIVGTAVFSLSYFCVNYLQIMKSSSKRDLEKILRIN
jgi:hypothetical protein